MTWLFSILSIIIFLFGFVLLFGAPFVPTLKAQQLEVLKLLDLKPGQTLVELGSGDGRMLIAAARLGIKTVGFELNPLLVLCSKLITFRYRHLVKIKWADFWRQKLPECDGIYVFLLDRYMAKLHTKITREIPSSVKVVSYAFYIPGMKPITESNGLILYKYPAKN